MSKVYQVTHLVPILLSRFESTTRTVDDGEDESDKSENLLSKDLSALRQSVRFLLDGLLGEREQSSSD